VPHPPILVPDLATELASLRDACRRAVDDVVSQEPDMLVFLGWASLSRRYPADVTGSLSQFGVDADYRLGAEGQIELALSLTIGAYLTSHPAALVAELTGRVTGQLLLDGAPYGVYFVASWTS
jgi:hypothetical protein